MRAGSLSKEPINSRLRNRFICGYRNIAKEKYSGHSGVHPLTGPAVHTTNGAGPRNLQLFVLAPDGTVLHCLPGYWNPNDIATELDLAEKLMPVWQDKAITREQKEKIFAKHHQEHIHKHPTAMVNRSTLQGFDRLYIYKNQNTLSDAIKNPSLLFNADEQHLPEAAFKSTDAIMHERISKRPFLAYKSFDVANYVNYGTQYYDKDEKRFDPSSVAKIKTNDLRSLLYETWTPKASSTKVAAKKKSDKVGDIEGAIRDLKNIDKMLVQGFWMYVEQGKYDKAEKAARVKINRDPKDPKGYQMMAILKYYRGEYHKSAVYAYRAINYGAKSKRHLQLYRSARELSRRSEKKLTSHRN